MTKKAYDIDAGTLTFDFENGNEITINVSDLPADIQRQAMFHGLSQKIGDSYAGAASAVKEGLAETAAEYAESQVRDQVERLKAGDWTSRTPGAGGASVTDLARALSEVGGKPVDEVAAMLADKDKDEKAALRKHPAVAEVLARLRAERAAKKAEEAGKKAEGAEAPDLSDFGF